MTNNTSIFDPIIKNGTFTAINEDDIFNSNTGTTYSTDAGKGWIVPLNHKWNFDGLNQWAKTDHTGAGGLIQVIEDNQLTQGQQSISFDATNMGSDNTLRLQVYGIDGEFAISNWSTQEPVSLDGSALNVVTLLDTDDLATEEFDWTTFSWDSVDFGSGYEYIALRFWTDGVDETEFQAIDNVTIGVEESEFQAIDNVTIEIPISSNSNIISDGEFSTSDGNNIFNSNTGTTYSTDAGKGWIVPLNHKWNFDGLNQWAKTDHTGAGGLIQVIEDNQLTQGGQSISFDATNMGSDNTLRLQVYGIDGEFAISNWSTQEPVSLDGSALNVVTLLDTDDLATEEFDWKTFSWDDVDFGSGYEYITLRFWTDGVDESEFQAIDNVIVSPEPNNPKTPPQAYDDHFVTQKNQSLTILGSDILKNDVDPNGQILKITEVTNASNGTVSVDTQGNIFFSPNADFAGVTTFDYVIENEQGLLSSATVTVNVANDIALGTNLHKIADWSPQHPFIDRFKSSRQWLTQADGIWDTKEDNLLDLDENGWVKSLPALEDAPKYSYVSTLFTTIKEGRYIVLYEGEGEIEYKLGADIDEAVSVQGRDVIDVGDRGNLLLTITETDPNQTGDYIRNIRLIPETDESTYQTETFNSTFLEKTQSFGAVRFMDWMETNNSTQGEWSERPTLDSSTWSESGPPVEVMVELANILDVDPWFTMPHLATDEYVTNFATYIRDNLEPERTVYVEYSNEVWNWQFKQATWVNQQAENDPNFDGNWMNWFGKRTTEITQIWDQVFDETGQKDRVIGVMGAQAANRWIAEQALDYDSWSRENKTHADYGIDAIAIAPYFGLSINSSNEAEIEQWNLDQLFDELTHGGVLSDGHPGGALQRSAEWIESYADLAKQEGLQLIAYEGGQHLVASQNETITDLFIEANRDPRMGELYTEYFSNWYEQGGGLFMNYLDVSTPSKWGSWGTLESIEQTSSPKYDALMDLINYGIEHSTH